MALDFPNNPVENDQFVTTHGIYVYTNSRWELSQSSRAPVHVGAAPPAEPHRGQLWWHSTAATMYIYNRSWATLVPESTPHPAITGNTGKYLRSDGTDAYWVYFSIPTVNAPTVNISISATDVPISSSFTITTSAFSVSFASAGSDTHASTNWYIIDSDNQTVWSDMESANLLSKSFPGNALESGQQYQVRAQHTGVQFGTGPAGGIIITTA